MKTNSLFACSISFLFLIDLSNIKKKRRRRRRRKEEREKEPLCYMLTFLTSIECISYRTKQNKKDNNEGIRMRLTQSIN